MTIRYHKGDLPDLARYESASAVAKFSMDLKNAQIFCMWCFT